MPTLLPNGRYVFHQSAHGLSQSFALQPFLFLTPAHLATQASDPLLFFQLLDSSTDKIVAHFPVFQNSEKGFFSPGRATFGGVQVAPGLPAEVIFDFLKEVLNRLKQAGNGIEIRIKAAPLGYAPSESTLLANAFLNSGFRVLTSEVNHHIPVSEKDFADLVQPATRRRLLKCHRAGFSFGEEAAVFLPEAYAFIKNCRDEKGHDLSLDYEALASLFNQFPADFRIFSVRDESRELAACTVAVRVNQDVFYNFYPASPLKFNDYSPAIMLAEGLFNLCWQQGFRLLDLGTSQLPEGPNFPLMQFKRNIGGEPSLKLTFGYQG